MITALTYITNNIFPISENNGRNKETSDEKYVNKNKTLLCYQFHWVLRGTMSGDNHFFHFLCHRFGWICSDAVCKRGTKRGKMKQTLYSAHAEDTGSTAEQPEGILMGNTRALQSP